MLGSVLRVLSHLAIIKSYFICYALEVILDWVEPTKTRYSYSYAGVSLLQFTPITKALFTQQTFWVKTKNFSCILAICLHNNSICCT